MSEAELRDTKTQSRKGRKPKGDVAMTSAERKRLQRERERDAEVDLPSWLILRRKMWRLVQEEFIFANADELYSALKGLSILLLIGNFNKCVNERDWLKHIRIYLNPDDPENDGITMQSLQGTLPELLPYRWDHPSKFDAGKQTILFDLIRDMIDGHEIKGGGE